ncbi:MAG: glycine zipper 2TM domain-containing protein [Proteobacteria bacterium]|nr:glycine zipper 2TM domain-containing protein [Pseudomonadota bacterium]
MNIRLTAGLAAATALLGLSTQAIADHDRGAYRATTVSTSGYAQNSGRSTGPIYDYAEVISSVPIIRYVTIRTPERECWEETEYYTVNHHPHGVVGGTLFGAILGGVVGHQFGSGRGNDAATVAGALIGAAIGSDAALRHGGGHYSRTQHSRPVKRCKTHYREHQEERIDGYDVVYRYNGRKYATRMPNDPGRRIRVRIDIRPAG